jgi:hypothetical protein
MRILTLLLSGLCFVGCDNQKPQKPAASPTASTRAEITVSQQATEVKVTATSQAEIIARAKAEVVAEQANAITQTKARLVGRWTNKETEVDKGIISSDKTDIFQRNITLSPNGEGSFNILKNGRVSTTYLGLWNLQGDILLLDQSNGVSVYWRLLRVSNERLVLRNDAGVERIYDRIQ